MKPVDGEDDRSEAPRGVNGLTELVLGPDAASLIGQMYAAHAGEARSLALAFLADEHLAQDAVHVAYLSILHRLLQGWRWGDDEEARATVLRNTRWAALTVIRKRRRRPEGELLDDAPAGEGSWTQSEARLLVERIVAQLRPSYRRALHYRYVEELPARDAAAQLGMTVKAYARLVDRAVLAARLVARGQGVSPLGALLATIWRPVQSKARRVPPRLRQTRTILRTANLAHVAVVAAITAAGVGAIHMAGTPSTTGPLSAPVSSPNADAAGGIAETIDDTVVVDVAGASAAGPPAAMVALGEGRRCNCWVVLETRNGGSTWTAANAPAIDSASPRLVVGAGFPADPRIAIVPSGGVDELVASRVGGDWAEAPAGSVEGGESAMAPCLPGSAGRVVCFGMRVTNPAGGLNTSRGSVVSLGYSWLIYLRPHGGVLCSLGGQTWATSCTARS